MKNVRDIDYDQKFKVSEIFYSIEGEGIRQGMPASFIRLFGCNLDCGYCDSKYACSGDEFSEMTLSDIVRVGTQCTSKNITITGGEPMLQNIEDLVYAFKYLGCSVNVETNGSFHIDRLIECNTDIITMDWKSISSGYSTFMKKSNLSLLRKQDVLKFVVSDQNDIFQMDKILAKLTNVTNVFVSPVYGEIPTKVLAENIKELARREYVNIPRMQLQIHKIIWDAESRGV